MNCKLLCLVAVVLLAPLAFPAAAQQEPDIDKAREGTAKLINLLIEQGVLSRDNAEALLVEVSTPAAPAAAPGRAASGRDANSAKLSEAPSAATAPTKAPTQAVRVTYIPEFVRREIKDEVRNELAAQAAREGWAAPGSVPQWTRGITVEGDLRTRYQFDNYSPENAPTINVTETNRTRAISLLNTTEDRHRLRVRARLSATAVVDENWSAGVRLTTGNTSDPISSNQTLGVYGNRFTAAFDRAYVRFRSGDEFNAVAGRFGNPWFGSDLVWANDLGFDGVALQWTPSLTARTRAFVTLAAMPVQEVELSTADKWLFGGQVGATLAGSPQAIGGKIGVGYFQYSKIEGQLSPSGSVVNEFTAPQFAQKGNTYFNISSDPTRPLLALASQYHLVNLTAQADFPVTSGKRVVILGDFVRNIGFKKAAVSERVGFEVEPQTSAYHVRFAFGNSEVKLRHDWQAFLAYKRIERDSMVDAFTDGDLRLGGTDAKGYILGASYGLGKNAATSVRFFSGDSISGPPLAIDTLQFDLNVRF